MRFLKSNAKLLDFMKVKNTVTGFRTWLKALPIHSSIDNIKLAVTDRKSTMRYAVSKENDTTSSRWWLHLLTLVSACASAFCFRSLNITYRKSIFFNF